MIRDEKLLKDRKILRKIDFNLAQQGRYLVAGNILIFLFVAIMGRFYTSHPSIALGFGASILIGSLLSYYYFIRFDAIYGAGPARWRTIFLTLQLGFSMLMGLLCATVIVFEGLSINAFLLSFYLVGYAAMNNVEWSPYHSWNVVRHLFTLSPAISAFTLIVDINGVTLAAGLAVLLVLLIRQSKLMNIRHWDNVRTHHELHTKARDLTHAVSEANSASQIKTEFLANITHEIRTPMNNVLGMLALLDDTDLSTQQKELQKVAAHAGEGLLSLIDDILDFSRITSGQINLNEQVFNLQKCINQALDYLGPRAHEHGLELSCVYDEDVPLRVKGDAERLAQLITNLVTNAIKYSAGSDILLSVHMQRMSEREGELRIDVRDNGKGIEPELQARIFDAFSSKSGRQDYSETGTGLGLAISKGLAECMGGDIGFSSEPDMGTVFWFTVRLRLSTQQAQKPSFIKELMNLRILMVDVNGGLREALQAEMASWKPTLVFADDHSKIIDSLLGALQKGAPYDLLVVNHRTNKQTDFQLYEQLLAVPELKDTKILMLTSLSQRTEASRIAALQALQLEWISKPVTQEKLCRALVQMFQLQKEGMEVLDKMESLNQEGLEGRRILLVEDNTVSEMVARGMLNKLGYVVTTARNGAFALDALQESPFDLVLMDCLMPIMDGYEATKLWRLIEAERGGHIPILAMTALGVEGQQQHCLAVGMDDYLSKPVNIELLNAKIHQWLGGVDAAEDYPELANSVPQGTKTTRKSA